MAHRGRNTAPGAEAKNLELSDRCEQGAVSSGKRIPTERDRGYDAVLERSASLLLEVIRDAGADPRDVPIGVGMPGGVTRAGLVKNSNTVCLNGRP